VGIALFFLSLRFSQATTAQVIYGWAEANESYGGNVKAWLYIGVYSVCGVESTALRVMNNVSAMGLLLYISE
jgi:hypothetical protein